MVSLTLQFFRLVLNLMGPLGLVPTEKIEELMKPFAINEVDYLSSFLKSLEKHGSLDALLDKKTKF